MERSIEPIFIGSPRWRAEFGIRNSEFGISNQPRPAGSVSVAALRLHTHDASSLQQLQGQCDGAHCRLDFEQFDFYVGQVFE